MYRRFWAPTPEARREKLMPFFWGTLMREHSFIPGNRELKSPVALTNRHWFSYPGYSEVLVGAAHDDEIKSNDPIRNPYPTVLEFIRQKRVGAPTTRRSSHPGAYSTRSANAREGGRDDQCRLRDLPHVRSGDGSGWSNLQFQTPTPWDTSKS